MPLNIIKFFKPSYLFEMQPSINISTVYFLLVIFGALVLIGILIKIVHLAKKRENFASRLLNMYFALFLTMGLVGGILVWFRYERAYFLAGRFMLLVWLICFLGWLVFILRYQYKVVPKAKKQMEEKQMFNKYLPGTQKHKNTKTRKQ